MPDAEIPEQLRRLQFVRFDTGTGVTRPLAQLAEALRRDLEWIREHTRLGELATRWQARSQPESLLLRGDDLDAAKGWVAKRKAEAPEITELQGVFINASEQAEAARLSKERTQLEEMRRAQQTTARSQRRAGRLLWVVAMLVLTMLGGVMWQSYDVARRETLVYTSLAAKALNDEQFDRTLRYALQRYPARGSIPWLTPFSGELEGKIAGAAQLSRLYRLLKGHTGWVWSAMFSPDGKRVVTASNDTTARLWDAESGTAIAVLRGHTGEVAERGVQPGRQAHGHRVRRQHGAAVGRRERNSDRGAPRPCGFGVARGVQPGRQARGHCVLRQDGKAVGRHLGNTGAWRGTPGTCVHRKAGWRSAGVLIGRTRRPHPAWY